MAKTHSEREAFHDALNGFQTMYREHKYVGGPPPRRIRRMQIAHEVRARKLNLQWDLVDLRIVHARTNGLCGICWRHVSLEECTIDHIIPVSRRGPHTFDNLQVAHRACNSKKGNR